MQFYQVGVTHAAGEEAMERPAMRTRRKGRHRSRVRMAFQKETVIARSMETKQMGLLL